MLTWLRVVQARYVLFTTKSHVENDRAESAAWEEPGLGCYGPEHRRPGHRRPEHSGPEHREGSLSHLKVTPLRR